MSGGAELRIRYLEPLKTRRTEELMHVKSVELYVSGSQSGLYRPLRVYDNLQSLLVGVVWIFGEGFVEWSQNEIAVLSDFHKRILFSDEAHFWLNGYVNKQNCRIWSEANPQVYVETPLHPEKLTVWCALWAGGILLQKR
ncbi:hypothetical protein TNCV_707031 [Trichonephila clavipes]|nr:hypothetical protein TNCV_707031 [Trichonephila clavipes]